MIPAETQVHVGDFGDAPEELLMRALETVLADDGRSGELSLALVSDQQMTALNRRYRGEDGTTDVIAFALGSDDAPLGDVYVCVDQARRQADDLGVPLDEELVRLTIHGSLHALGHDHPDGPERLESPMFTLQERLVGEVVRAEA